MVAMSGCACAWRSQVRGGGGRYALSAKTRRHGALMQRHASCGARGDRVLRRHPHFACNRIDAIAQGCERPKRGSASFALRASRVVPHGCIKRTARVAEKYR